MSNIYGIPILQEYLPNAESWYITSYLKDLDLWTNYMQTLPYTQGTIMMYGKQAKEGRLTVVYGTDVGGTYSYSGKHVNKLPFPYELEYLRTNISNFCASSFNSLLINCYRDGNDSIGMHSDKEVHKDSLIASISLGTVRKFVIECRPEAPIQHEKRIIELQPGSLFVMGRYFQKYYKHGVNKEKTAFGTRYNLTYRIN